MTSTIMAVIAAGETTSSAPSLEQFLQYGVLGLVVIGFIFGWIAPGYILKKEQEENARLRNLIESDVLPALTTYTETLARTNEVLDAALRVIGAAESAKSG